MRRAGSVCQDLGKSVKHTKNQLRDYMEKSQPGWLGSRHRDAGIPASRGLKIYHVIAIAGTARLAGTTLSRYQILLESKMAHQKIDISLFIEHIKAYQTIKLRKTENNTPK